MRRPFAGAVTLLLLALPVAAEAQCAIDVVEAGIQAYRDLDLVTAADLLNNALDANGRDSSPCATVNARALTFLGATQWLDEKPDSATQAFERAVIHAPRFRPDVMEFPPSITDLFDRVRSETPAVAVTLPDRVAIGPGADDYLPIVLTASTEHWVTVTVQTPSGRPVRTVYQGPVVKGAQGTYVAWDGRGSEGDPVSTGWYDLSVVSSDSNSLPVRKVVIGLTIESDAPIEPEVVVDSAALAAAGVRRSEQMGVWKAVAISGAGLIGSAIVITVPLVVHKAPAGWARYPVAGAIGVSSLVGLVRRVTGRSRDDVAAMNAEADRAAAAAEAEREPPTLQIRVGYERRTELRAGTSAERGPGGGR